MLLKLSRRELCPSTKQAVDSTCLVILRRQLLLIHVPCVNSSSSEPIVKRYFCRTLKTSLRSKRGDECLHKGRCERQGTSHRCSIGLLAPPKNPEDSHQKIGTNTTSSAHPQEPHRTVPYHRGLPEHPRQSMRLASKAFLHHIGQTDDIAVA